MYLIQPAVLTGRDGETEKTKVAEYLTSVAQSEQLKGIIIKAEVVADAVAPILLSYTEPSKADLFAMSSRGYTGSKRWALGSVADKVIRHTTVPWSCCLILDLCQQLQDILCVRW